jgi:hypothetical protein
MDRRRLIAALLGAGVTAAALWFYAAQPRHARPAPAVVPIVDGKTIDFSSGTPTVRDSPADQAVIDAAVKEMDEATKSVTFHGDPPKK